MEKTLLTKGMRLGLVIELIEEHGAENISAE